MKGKMLPGFLPFVCGVIMTITLLLTLSDVENTALSLTHDAVSDTQFVYLPIVSNPPAPPLLGAAIGYTGAYDGATLEPRLFFPSFRKDDLGWNSTIAIQNISDQTTALTITFFHQDGTIAHTVDNISLQPFGTYIALAEDFTSLVNGFYAVAAIASENIVGMASTLDATGTMATAYNGASQGGQQIVIPSLFKDYFSLTSRLCLQNTTSMLANVTIEYLDTNGAIYTRWLDLSTDGFECIDGADDSFLPADFNGSALITTNVDIVVAAEDIRATGGWARGYLGFDLSTSTNIIYIPQCRNLNGWQTNISLKNVGPVSTDVNVSYRSADGETIHSFIVQENTYPWPNISCDDAPNFISPPWPIDNDYFGSAVIFANQSEIIALVTDLNMTNTDVFSYPGLSEPTTIAYLPNVGNGLNLWKGSLSVQNVDSVTNTIELFFYDQAGDLSHQLGDELPPYGMKAYDLDQLPGLKHFFEGSAIISTTHPVAVLISKER